MAIIETGGPKAPGSDPLIKIGQQSSTSPPIQGSLFERIARVVSTRFEQSESHLKGRFERFYRYEKILSMISKRKTFDWKANAYLPYALAVTEQSAAMKALALFGSRPFVKVTPRQAGLEDVAEHREALLDWRFLGDVNLYTTGAEHFRVAERYGKAISIIAPDWDEKVLKYRAAVNTPTVYGPIARITWKTTQERAYKIRWEMVDNVDVYPQPGFKRINGRGGMRWIMRRYYLTIDELRGLEQTDLWGPTVGGQEVSMIRDTQQQDLNEYKMRRLYLDHYDDFEPYRDQFDRTVEIIEYQGIVPDELVDPMLAQAELAAGMDPKHRLITLCNRKVVGINQALPWDHRMKSYIEMDCIPNPYDFWGTGKVEPIEHLVYVGNEIMNMRLDNVKAAINGIIGVDGTRMPAGWKRRLVSQPWGVVETMGPPQEVIQRLQLGDVTASSYQEQQQVFSLIQEASAINETMIGAPGGAVRTLGEHQMKAQSGSNRIHFELLTQAMQLFGPTREFPGLVYMIINLDRQYLPLPQYVNVVDPMVPDDFVNVELEPSDLGVDDENFTYVPQGAMEGMNKQARRLEFAQLNQVLSPMIPLALAGGFNVIEYIKTALRTFDYDPDKFFPKMLGVVGPGAMGMGTGPGAAGMPMGATPGVEGATQPAQREASAGTSPGQNRYVGRPQKPEAANG